MELGITMFATDLSMTVSDLAVEAENRGLCSLYIPEHTHTVSYTHLTLPTTPYV